MDLKVCYYKNGIDTKLDEKIISFFESLGYEWYGQGFSTGKNIEREIVFDKK